jgi:hypothetical protein
MARTHGTQGVRSEAYQGGTPIKKAEHRQFQLPHFAVESAIHLWKSSLTFSFRRL